MHESVQQMAAGSRANGRFLSARPQVIATWARLLVLAWAAAVATVPSHAADFYKDNVVKIIVGYDPGGGVDAYSRLLARHMAQYIPGNPNIIVQNMPGAASMRAVQSLLTAPADGTYIVAFNPGNITLSLTDPEKINFRFDEAGYLGSIGAEAQMCYMWHSTGITSFDQLLNRPEIHMGTSAPGSSGYILSAVLRNMFGARIKLVTGYTGRAQEHLAVERGELDGQCATLDGTPAEWIEHKKINLLVRFARSELPGNPGVPYIMDVAHPDAEQRAVMTVLFSINDMFRPYIVHKDVPADRLAMLQQAFMKTVTGAEFVSAAKREGRTVEDPMAGDQVLQLVKEMYRTPPAVLAKAAAAIR
jgi:tripartite-type tricarboxylate transporter receptor subunit TctC